LGDLLFVNSLMYHGLHGTTASRAGRLSEAKPRAMTMDRRNYGDDDNDDD
jgi:hypothetical protein